VEKVEIRELADRTVHLLEVEAVTELLVLAGMDLLVRLNLLMNSRRLKYLWWAVEAMVVEPVVTRLVAVAEVQK
jgi:hypothetical protein